MKCLKTTHCVPLDVILEILVWLPVKSALRFKCVSKEWYNLINTPFFAKLQLNKSLKPDSRHNRILLCNANRSISIVDDIYDPLKWIKLNWPKDTVTGEDIICIVGSCNGLVCFKVIRQNWPNDNTKFYYKARCFLICNPTTRTFKSILPCSETKWTNNFISYGFGYDSEHDDYKIVGTRSRWRVDDGERHVFIYSLKTDLWSSPTPLTLVSTERRCLTIIQRPAILVNDMLHYLVSFVTQGPINEYKIARFDVVYEKWRDDLRLPVKVNGHVRVGELDGRLYLHVGEYGIESSEIWMMEEYGSWKKMFHLPKEVYKILPIALSKDGSHRLFIRDYYNYSPRLFWYDQRDNTRTSSFTLNTLLPGNGGSFKLCIASLVAIPGCSLTKLQQLEDGA
ncbi:F-box/kelch-repeat protein At3g23880-like [Silene latifolia]|uniref:F-box/kelch-repeat protein At3g23880-like n=1 Tax=Silene latifolia TaxID=37657 RepID=UPI003D783A28